MTETTSEPDIQTLEIYEKLKQFQAVVFYEKPLTSSDSNGAGRVVIPKQVAHAHFPHFQDHTPQLIPAIDTEGAQYDLRFRYWVNGSSRMYLLEGLSDLHRKFKLGTGDVMIFARLGDGSLLLAGRQGTKDDIIKKVPRHGRGETRHREYSENYSDQRAESAKKKRRTAVGKTPRGVVLFPDGVFRQVNSTFPPEIMANDIVEHNGLFFTGIDVDGEVYAAVFANRDDAMEAFIATGCGELNSTSNTQEALVENKDGNILPEIKEATASTNEMGAPLQQPREDNLQPTSQLSQIQYQQEFYQMQ